MGYGGSMGIQKEASNRENQLEKYISQLHKVTPQNISKMKNMTLPEIKELKIHLEDAINTWVLDFEKKTGLTVGSVTRIYTPEFLEGSSNNFKVEINNPFK